LTKRNGRRLVKCGIEIASRPAVGDWNEGVRKECGQQLSTDQANVLRIEEGKGGNGFESHPTQELS
jgi:hypothetical protein